MNVLPPDFDPTSPASLAAANLCKVRFENPGLCYCDPFSSDWYAETFPGLPDACLDILGALGPDLSKVPIAVGGTATTRRRRRTRRTAAARHGASSGRAQVSAFLTLGTLADALEASDANSDALDA